MVLLSNKYFTKAENRFLFVKVITLGENDGFWSKTV